MTPPRPGINWIGIGTILFTIMAAALKLSNQLGRVEQKVESFERFRITDDEIHRVNSTRIGALEVRQSVTDARIDTLEKKVDKTSSTVPRFGPDYGSVR